MTVARWVCPRRGGARARRQRRSPSTVGRGPLALVDGDDVCAAVRAYRRDAVQKHGVLKDASRSVTTDGVGLPARTGACVRGASSRGSNATGRRRARFAVRDDYLAGCVAADRLGARAGTTRSSRSSRRPSRRATPRPRAGRVQPAGTLLLPARRARHLPRRAPEAAPGAPGRALARRRAPTRAGARGGLVLARGAGAASAAAEPAAGASRGDLTARPRRAAAAARRAARVTRRRLGGARGRACAARLRRGRARRGPRAPPGAPGDDWGWDEVALLKHGEA